MGTIRDIEGKKEMVGIRKGNGTGWYDQSAVYVHTEMSQYNFIQLTYTNKSDS